MKTIRFSMNIIIGLFLLTSAALAEEQRIIVAENAKKEAAGETSNLNLAAKAVSSEKQSSPAKAGKKKPTVEELESFITDRINASPINYRDGYPTSTIGLPHDRCGHMDKFIQVNVSFPERCTIRKTIKGERTDLISNQVLWESASGSLYACDKEYLHQVTGTLTQTDTMKLKLANPELIRNDSVNYGSGEYGPGEVTNGISIGCSNDAACVKSDANPGFSGNNSSRYKKAFFFVTEHVRDESDIIKAIRMIVEECADAGVENPLR